MAYGFHFVFLLVVKELDPSASVSASLGGAAAALWVQVFKQDPKGPKYQTFPAAPNG